MKKKLEMLTAVVFLPGITLAVGWVLLVNWSGAYIKQPATHEPSKVDSSAPATEVSPPKVIDKPQAETKAAAEEQLAEEVQSTTEEQPVEDTQTAPAEEQVVLEEQPVEVGEASTAVMTAAQFKMQGVVYANGYRFTYYKLPMSGVEAMHGVQFHDRGDGVLVDADGYVVLAYGMSGYGQMIDTPLGTGKVYDHCPEGAVDIAVNF